MALVKETIQLVWSPMIAIRKSFVLWNEDRITGHDASRKNSSKEGSTVRSHSSGLTLKSEGSKIRRENAGRETRGNWQRMFTKSERSQETFYSLAET